MRLFYANRLGSSIYFIFVFTFYVLFFSEEFLFAHGTIEYN